MKQQLLNIKKDTDYRIIAISDIHGHNELMEKMLEKIQLQEDDYLIIIGDFINRGGDSVKSYKLIKKIANRQNTFILKGNHEFMIHRYLQDKDIFYKLHDFLKSQQYETIVDTMLKEHKRDVFSFNNSDELYDFMNEHYSEMIEFLSSLPVMLIFNDFIFVHGGYSKEFTLPQDEHKFLKYDFYNEKSKKNEKKIIVGHWPACNMRTKKISNKPYFNDEKNIIFIDGGLGTKATGELNALIIEKRDNVIVYDNVQVNNFTKKKIIQEHQFIKEDTIYVDYPHLEIELIEHRESMSLCKHLHSNKLFSIFNSFLTKDNDTYKLNTYNFINNFLNLKIGDYVELCEVYDDCALVKHNGEFGWVLSSQID
ncbi:metallophosphoesterase [Clostridium sp. 'deep sea']|uniref:metallophosphoesterase n=1 Tax=Clostridium sp. 'deep sea' TaxID=2779445 RepID=UPI00189660B9|nr:metallophosphoesterase [Clostridium sp. 'deep sea']QOR34894.1 metallophosphoesterase [Clostridium sp. 'deep sea']